MENYNSFQQMLSWLTRVKQGNFSRGPKAKALFRLYTHTMGILFYL
jgi:hypothetical protein